MAKQSCLEGALGRCALLPSPHRGDHSALPDRAAATAHRAGPEAATADPGHLRSDSRHGQSQWDRTEMPMVGPGLLPKGCSAGPGHHHAGGTSAGMGAQTPSLLPWKSLSLRARASTTFLSSSASLKGPSSSSGQLRGGAQMAENAHELTGLGSGPRSLSQNQLLKRISFCGRVSSSMWQENKDREEQDSH